MNQTEPTMKTKPTTMKTVTCTTDQYDTYSDGYATRRVHLPAPTWTGHETYGTGVTLEAVYVSLRARRCIIHTNSIWDDGTGHCTGDVYHLVTDPDHLNRLAELDPAIAAALDRAGITSPEEL